MFQKMLQVGSGGSGNFAKEIICFERKYNSASYKPIYVAIYNQDGLITDSIATPKPLTINGKFLKFDCGGWSDGKYTRIIALSNVTVSVDFGADTSYNANDVILNILNGDHSWHHSVVVKN